MSFLPGDIVQTTDEDYTFAEVIHQKGDQVKMVHRNIGGDTTEITMNERELRHVGIARPVYKVEDSEE